MEQTKALRAMKLRAKALKKDVFALYIAYKDPRVKWYAKLFILLIVAYAFSPIDLIPDFVPVLGYLDDIVLIPLGVYLAIKMVPDDVMVQARKEAEEKIKAKPKNWIAGGIIIAIWVILAIYFFVLLKNWLYK